MGMMIIYKVSISYYNNMLFLTIYMIISSYATFTQSITLDVGTRVIRDSLMWSDVNLPKLTTNSSWNDGVEAVSLHYGFDQFDENTLRAVHFINNEYLSFFGGIRHLGAKERDSAIQYFERIKRARVPDRLLVENDGYSFILLDSTGIARQPPKVTQFRLVRVFQVMEDRVMTDASGTDCDCVFDLDTLKMISGLDEHGLNKYSEECSGIRLCMMTSHGTTSPFMDKGLSNRIVRTLKVLSVYELSLFRKKCKQSKSTKDLTDFIKWVVSEEPWDSTFQKNLQQKQWNIIC